MNKDIHRPFLALMALFALPVATAQAQLPANNGSRGFDLRMQQYQSQRLWRPADPTTRQQLESRDYQRQMQLHDQNTRQQQDPVPPQDSATRHQRERQGLNLDLRLDQAQDPNPPTPKARHYDLLGPPH